jgi:hypothetical protein
MLASKHFESKFANVAFYFISFVVFYCVEYHGTTRVRQTTSYLLFFKVLAELTELNMNAPPLNVSDRWLLSFLGADGK